MTGTRRLLVGLITGVLTCGAVSAVAGCGSPVTPARGGPAQVIVDTDMSSDDIMALIYLLEDPGISVRAVTVEGTGVAHGLAGARNVLRLIRALGIRRPIPVAYGPPYPVSGFRSFPLGWRATADRMYGLSLPAWPGPRPRQSAVQLLAASIRQSPRPVELITLGPLTNLALALRADADLSPRIARIYAMAGAVRVDGNEPVHGRAEWNMYIDATAAARVLRSGIPMTFIPLDASDNVPITMLFRDAVQAHARTPGLRLVATMLRDPYYLQAPTYFWDPLAAVAATDQQVVRLRDERLVIGTAPGPGMGATSVSPAGTMVRLAVAASAPAFQRQFLAVLNAGRPVPVPSVPAARRVTVSFSGTTYRYSGPHSLPAGLLEVRLADLSPVPFDGYDLIIGKLLQGRTLADVQAVIRQGTVTRVPGWFQVTAILPDEPSALPAWGVALAPGRYALVCEQRHNSALDALTEVTVSKAPQ